METKLETRRVENRESDSGHATDTEEEVEESSSWKGEQPPAEVVWPNIWKFVVLHSLAVWGLLLLPTMSPSSWLWLLATYQLSGAGITAGAHRLWSHRTYKARLPLRVFLVFCNSMAGQNSVYTWSRDHRTHHKHSETDADPHNSKRGFFFAHMGWLCLRKHPAVTKAGSNISLADLEQDRVVMFQHRHYLACFLVCGFLIPSIVPVWLWGEAPLTAFLSSVLRYVAVLHFTWLVNSAAHMFGNKPYDTRMGPAENRLVSLLAMGEGFHNYHHTFPYDYSTSEWGLRLNVTTGFIELMAWLGLAYDLRQPSRQTVIARARRTGQLELTRYGSQAGLGGADKLE